jgi:hypothetical protein
MNINVVTKDQNFFISFHLCDNIGSLVEKANDLASNVLATGLLVVHDSSRCGENHVTELTRWKELDDPFLEVTELDVVAGADDTGLVDTAY